MQFTIEVVSVETQTKPNKTGSYQMAILAYRNETSGKLEEKKLMSFTNKPLFEMATAATKGSRYEVVAEKGDKYWEWTKMSPIAPGTTNKVSNMAQTSNARTYETADERAERQVLIVRQSSLSAAVATLVAGAKNSPDPDAVLALADRYSNWVFQKDAKAKVSSVFSAEELADLPNDI